MWQLVRIFFNVDEWIWQVIEFNTDASFVIDEVFNLDACHVTLTRLEEIQSRNWIKYNLTSTLYNIPNIIYYRLITAYALCLLKL